jgi:ParB family chromosome partitioning protein
MAAIRDLGKRGPSTVILDPNIILENPQDNTRDMDSPESQSHIREMANAIINDGNELFPPITVYQDEGTVYVAAGWCRRRAHILAINEGAPVAGILCLVTPKKKQEDLTLSILTSNDGLPLTAMEKAKAVHRLTKYLWSVSEISKKTGWSETTITNFIQLYEAPDSITQMVKDGKVSATFATEIVKSKGSAEAEKILKSAADTAEKAGKKKATKKDLQDVAEKKVNWKFYGPKIYKLLNGIYETPVGSRDKLQTQVAAAGELLAEMEEKYPDLAKSVREEF